MLSYFCFSCSVIWNPAFGQQAKPVVVVRVIETETRSGQRVVGTVKPLRTSTIGSAVDGRVRDFLVNAGDLVKEGQTLAQLRTATLAIELAASKAELELAESRLAELENGSRPEDIAEADANMRIAASAVKNTEAKLRRIQALNSAASVVELDDAQEQANAAKFALIATEALLKRIKDGPRKETIAQAKAQVELQKQRLNQIKDRLEKCTIIAPFDGFISTEFTEVGAWINRGDPIAEIIQLDEVEINAPITAEAVVNLRKGDVIRVEFPTDTMFVPGTYQIQPAQTPLLQNLVTTIRESFPRQIIGIEAHWDKTPLNPPGTTDHQLTATQALAVFNNMIRLGLSPDQLFTMAMGSNRPRHPQGTRGSISPNRRVEIVIYPETFDGT